MTHRNKLWYTGLLLIKKERNRKSERKHQYNNKAKPMLGNYMAYQYMSLKNSRVIKFLPVTEFCMTTVCDATHASCSIRIVVIMQRQMINLRAMNQIVMLNNTDICLFIYFMFIYTYKYNVIRFIERSNFVYFNCMLQISIAFSTSEETKGCRCIHDILSEYLFIYLFICSNVIEL